MGKFLKRYKIFVLSLILVGGFFLSFGVFVWTGGDPYGGEYFNGASVAALSVVVLTYGAAYKYFRWSQK